MSNITKASFEDYEKVVNTANTAFSITFEELLPKLYEKENFSAESHYIVKENENVCAIVGSFRNTLTVLNETINVSGIGTVCVHPQTRSKGYMKQLMNLAIQDMKNNDIDLAYLDGNRKRYEYFSFTPSGTDINFTFDKPNLKHSINSYSYNNFEIKEVLKVDTDILSLMLNLFNKRTVKANRDMSNFYDILVSWKYRPFSIWQNNEFVGYLLTSEDKSTICEFELLNYDNYLQILNTYLDKFDIDAVTLIHIPMYQNDRVSLYSLDCSSFNICNSKNFAVLNFKKVISTFLKLKSTYTKLLNGSLIIDILDYEKIKININNNDISICNTTENADLTLSYFQAIQFIFGTSSYFEYNCVNNNWFPLPLHFDIPDSV